MSGAPAIRVRGARARHPGSPQDVFSAVELELTAGETFALVGPSGCGKSTLLRALAGLQPLVAGTIERADPTRRPTLVLQKPALLPWLDVRENVRLGHRFAANRDAARRIDADELLRGFGIAPLAARYPDELSGGQQQLVAFARAIATDPDVLLLDEPFAALDPATRRSMQDWLRDLASERGQTTVLVTHDPDEALHLGHRVGLLRRGVPGIGPVWDAGRAERCDLPDLPARRELLALYETGVRARPAQAPTTTTAAA
ncbi:ABC transporter ATP-binding protein [Conexibacter sp. CPCC 206217]|uniref:ABC transporter ATP-binding protein n=1 Tax=Conexibacter sp. CPCC 206217 TaxID=3064574 RepID=UPI00272807E5|nr:ATP-binding cassette domain-containing protein [Conexibacter sp. CPCC 206217]MDO8212361.1 ATP-binding cassette domain-containing protein [Conexibacter sp. CPCC 206217]